MAFKKEETFSYVLKPMTAGVPYKLFITSVVEIHDKDKTEKIESKELAEKVVIDKVNGLMVWSEEG